jgi:lysophospholipase
VVIVQPGDDARVWKTTAKWAARRMPKGRYVESPASRHEILMETDDKRELFFREFDTVAEQVAPRAGYEPLPAPVGFEDQGEPPLSVGA